MYKILNLYIVLIVIILNCCYTWPPLACHEPCICLIKLSSSTVFLYDLFTTAALLLVNLGDIKCKHNRPVSACLSLSDFNSLGYLLWPSWLSAGQDISQFYVERCKISFKFYNNHIYLCFVHNYYKYYNLNTAIQTGRKHFIHIPLIYFYKYVRGGVVALHSRVWYVIH